MRVAFDGQEMIGALTGAGHAARRLVDGLRRVDPGDEGIVLRPGDRARWRMPQQLSWDQVAFPWHGWRAGVDLLASAGRRDPWSAAARS